MAEMKELLELAAGEAEGFAADATRLQHTLERLAASATTLEEGLEVGLAHAHTALSTLLGRVEEGEEEVIRETTSAMAGLAGVEAAAKETIGTTHELVGHVNESFAHLHSEQGRVAEELKGQGEATHAAVLEYAHHTREVHAKTEGHLDQVHRAVHSVRSQAEEARAALSERRQALSETNRSFEAHVRGEMHQVLRVYDALASAVEAKLRDVQAAAKSLSDQVATRLERKLAQETLDGLAQSASTLKDALHALDHFAVSSREKSSSRLSDASVAIEDVARALDRMRPSLDLLRQHLR